MKEITRESALEALEQIRAEMFLAVLEDAENAPAISRETSNMLYVMDSSEMKMMLA